MTTTNQRTSFILLIVMCLFFIGCGYTEGVLQQESKSYLWFTGNTEKAIVFIDENKPFEIENYYIDPETGQKIKKDDIIHYQVSPGKHKIIVKKDGEVVVERILILGNGITKEIRVP